MSRRLKIVVTGYIGLLPAGGVTWDYIQYPLGFRHLGHEVLYLEDTCLSPTYHRGSDGISCETNVAYLAATMQHFGMDDVWSYRDVVSGRSFGMEANDVERFCATADLLVNVSCSAPLRPEYSSIPLRALIDTDPMFTQVQLATGTSLTGDASTVPEMVTGHTHLFTFGENVGRPGCDVPTQGLRWFPTRQPVVLEYWPFRALPPRGSYTSVFNWSAAKSFEYRGAAWGQKDVEFLRFLGIPKGVPGVPFTIAVGQTEGDRFPAEAVRSGGWKVLDATDVVADDRAYQQFIYSSRAEFSVAKQTYVRARTGWFSCRSACYLAAGRPVVTQDTGWSEFFPTGAGLFGFDDLAEAVSACRRIERRPKEHARAARSIAEDAFDSDKVLTRLLQDVGL